MKMIIKTIIILIITFSLLSNTLLSLVSSRKNKAIKYALNTSCKVVADVISREREDIEHIADGYLLDNREGVNLDLDRLDKLFDEMVEYNLPNSMFEKRNIKAKIVISDNKMFIAKGTQPWLIKHFLFEGKILNIFDDNYQNQIDGDTFKLDTSFKKDEIIKKQIQKEIRSIMVDASKNSSYEIGIKTEKITLQNRNFNAIDGVTFFVIYVEEFPKIVNFKIKRNSEFSLAGYTLNTIKQQDN